MVQKKLIDSNKWIVWLQMRCVWELVVSNFLRHKLFVQNTEIKKIISLARKRIPFIATLVGVSYAVKVNFCLILKTLSLYRIWHYFGAGGSLICCERCPASFHMRCLGLEKEPEGSYICIECIDGKTILYGDIVWVKIGTYRCISY